MNYVILNVKCKVTLTDAYLEPSRTCTMELFSLRLSHILKTSKFNRIAFRFHFLHNSPFREKTSGRLRKLRKKSILLTMELFFFEI